jgi:hypothetical protein
MKRKELEDAIEKFVNKQSEGDAEDFDCVLHRFMDDTFPRWNSASIAFSWPVADKYPDGHPSHTVGAWAECARCGATLEGYYAWVATELNNLL